MARDSDSYIFRKGVSPNTLSVISSKNRVFAYAANGLKTQLGVVATFDPSEARTIEPVRGIGFGDHIAELVPGVTDPMSISITRTALYLSNVFQVFGYKSGIDGIVRSLRHHRWPFDIRQEMVFSTLASTDVDGPAGPMINPSVESQGAQEGTDASKNVGLLTIYEACWISDYSVSYASDTALVQESVTINVSDIIASTDLNAYYANAEPYSVLNDSATGMSVRLTRTTQ